MDKNFEEQILEALKSEYKDGLTQAEMAEKRGMKSHTSINNFINGTRSVRGMRLGTFFKLFPNATLVLGEKQQNITAGSISYSVIGGDNNGTIGSNCIKSVVSFVLESDEFTLEEKVKFARIMNEKR